MVLESLLGELVQRDEIIAVQGLRSFDVVVELNAAEALDCIVQRHAANHREQHLLDRNTGLLCVPPGALT
jgi:hypothetical protein